MLHTYDYFKATALFIICLNAAEGSIFNPLGEAPGNTYQLVFVTYQEIRAISTDIDYYNDFVQNAAANGAIDLTQYDTSWKAIVSTVSVNAFDNAPVLAPVYNLLGDRIDYDADGFWAMNHANPIQYTEWFAGLSARVWTGTLMTGVGWQPLGSYSPQYGDSGSDGNTWIGAGTGWNRNSERLYALSEILNEEPAAIPEPTTLALMGLGLAGIGYRRKRKLAA
jgi:hypothetical protein